MRGWKKSFQTNGNDKKAGVTTFISDKIDFKSKVIEIKKDTMIKGSIQGDDSTLINIYSVNIGATKYINTNRHKGIN